TFLHAAVRAVQERAAQLRVQRPLVTGDERPAVGNCVGKCPGGYQRERAERIERIERIEPPKPYTYDPQ
ncbi:MAG: hypothetical protein KIT31_39290, partial [Deltaproteobacteria bacterium]|nr:hypothetical protein [Deltaproteobacteria bacterium]